MLRRKEYTGLVKLNILVRDSNCKPHHNEWEIDVYDCRGNVLQYCGKKFVDMKTEHAHLTVEVPGGIYKVRGHSSCGNIWTDTAIVVVGCGEICVNLHDPTFWGCGITFVPALVATATIAELDPDLIGRAVSTITEVMEKVTPPIDRVYLDPERLDAMAKVLEGPYRSAIISQREFLTRPVKEREKK